MAKLIRLHGVSYGKSNPPKSGAMGLVEQQASSGFNAAMFCRQRGLCRKTFYHQRKILNEKSTSLVAERFIQVQAKPDRTMPIPDPLMAVLDYRQARLQIPTGIDTAWVAELMRSLP